MASLLTVLGARTSALALATMLTACGPSPRLDVVATPAASTPVAAPAAVADPESPAGDDPATEAATPAAESTVAPVPPPALQPDLPPPPPASLSITATAGNVDASAGIIVLATPIGTIRQIALTPESEVLATDGSNLRVADIPSGARLQVWGDVGPDGALVAQQVRVVPLT